MILYKFPLHIKFSSKHVEGKKNILAEKLSPLKGTSHLLPSFGMSPTTNYDKIALAIFWNKGYSSWLMLFVITSGLHTNLCWKVIMIVQKFPCNCIRFKISMCPYLHVHAITWLDVQPVFLSVWFICSSNYSQMCENICAYIWSMTFLMIDIS